MTQIQRAHLMALHMRELARDCVLPDYIEKMVRTAAELDRHAAELERERRLPG